jgi:hypothetical protein
MKVNDLTESEKKIWQAAETGRLVDVRAGNPELDSPERWAEWGKERTIRAEVLVDLLIGSGEATSMTVRGVRLQGARIIGDLNLEATILHCPLALLDCSFASDINLNEVTALSVRLSGSHIPAVRARQLRTRSDLLLDHGFSVSDGIELETAHIGGTLACTDSQFSNANGPALSASNLTVEGGMYCNGKFSATGGVRLPGAHIGGQLVCTDGQFSNANGPALSADGLTVESDMFCNGKFSATGEVSLLVAHIGGQLNCEDGQFSNANALALDLERATVSGSLFMEPAKLEGILDLTDAQMSSYRDNSESWPEKLRLDGFVYDAIDGASAKERLQWLRRNEGGYSPQIYEQLATVYRRTGHDEDARRILIAKQRRRSEEGNLADKIWGLLLWIFVGYGYRTWQALLWLVGLLIFGTYLFGYLHSVGNLTPANKPDVQPAFQPFLYTLDLLLPVVNLHVRDAWIAQGAAQGWSAFFIIMGWILATAVVLSLTGLLKRD